MPDELAAAATTDVSRAWWPRFGTWIEHDTVHARVWAPGRRLVELLLERHGAPARGFVLTPGANGVFEHAIPGARAGDRYRFLLDDEGPFPDPASRSQPDGVHGSSEIVDPAAFRWTDEHWTAPPPSALSIYELHVGTFSPEGTFAGVTRRLPYLSRLGVTAIELMPVAEFPGRWNWGYDGAALFAPARRYGRPDDLRTLVDTAHRFGLSVLLDVVYNHLGPDGAYLAAFAPPVFSAVHRTPWGPALNFDGPGERQVRDFFVDNALHWIHEYHVDGLRLDATHAIVDESPHPFLEEFAQRVRTGAGHDVVLIAEDHRNHAIFARPRAHGGWGYTGTWSDDFHHQVRRLVAGDDDGFYADYRGSTADLATTLRQGWLFTGQHSGYHHGPRGSDPAGLEPHAFTFFLQNHDLVGNRALGDRLHHGIDAPTYRALSVLLCCAPEMPLLFMGQEWAASTPFHYFTDHHAELGQQVTEGRRREFARFRAFASPESRERIPDPQRVTTFDACRLDWDEIAREPHASTLRLYHALLELRRDEPLIASDGWHGFGSEAAGDDALVLRRATDAGEIAVVARLRGAGEVTLGEDGAPAPGRRPWERVLDTEQPAFAREPVPVALDDGPDGVTLAFGRPGAVVLRRRANAAASRA